MFTWTGAHLGLPARMYQRAQQLATAGYYPTAHCKAQ